MPNQPRPASPRPLAGRAGPGAAAPASAPAAPPAAAAPGPTTGRGGADRLLFERNPLPMWVIDIESRRFLAANQAAVRAYGYSEAEFRAMTIFDIRPPEDRVRLEAYLGSRPAASASPAPTIWRHRRRDGEVFDAEIVADDITFEGRAARLVMARDATALRRAEAELRASRAAARTELLTMVASGAPLATVLEALVRMLEGELPGARCCLMGLRAGRLRVLAAPSLPGFFNQAADGLAPGPLAGSCGLAAHLGARVVAADIGTHPAWMAYRPLAAAAGVQACWSEPIVGRAGTLLGTFGVYHDHPHQPGEPEFALVAGAAQLAAIVIERRLADDALRESQKMESLGTLAGGIAHDFNNILGAILGNLDLLRREPGIPPAAAARLEQINQSAQRARSLVQQILAFGRRQPQALRDQPLRPLVEESLALLRASLPAGVQLRAVLAEQPLLVRADATQVQQVLMNLCSNAWHALPPEGGTIEVGFDALPSEGAARPGTVQRAGCPVHLWVRDSGSGMDDATRARIFEPFFTTKPVGRGTGLGLAVVHGIVSEHGGSIAVDSAPGRGSTFHVYLPCGEEAAARVGQPPAAAAGAAAAPAVARAHILCVDDDDVMRLAEEGVLQSHGHLVTSFARGADALEAVRTAPQAFDLVVADYNMPGLSGLELARALAALRPELPVIISTGYVTDELRTQAATLGVRELVRKENTVEELGEAVRRLLAGTFRPG